MFAYLYLVANPFPGFTGEAGTYPVALTVAEPAEQNRWKTGFRLVLVIPAWLIGSALGSALGFVALFGWFTGVFRAEMPRGLQRLGVFSLRYTGQLMAYTLLLTDRYPYGGPSQELLAPPALPEPAPG